MYYSETDVVVFHDPCPDGMACAWIFWKFKKDIKFIKGRLNEFDKPVIECDFKDKNIVFADFSYKKEKMIEIAKIAKKITVLDHHKSNLFVNDINMDNFIKKILLDKSGSQIVWDEIFGGERPWFIEDISDRDLWVWKNKDSKHSTKALYELGYYNSVEKFDMIPLNKREFYIEKGIVFNDEEELKINQVIDKAVLCKSKTTPSYSVYLAECHFSLVSEVGNRLSPNCDFSVLYRYGKDKQIICGARSIKVDLTKIVNLFDKNGGGHPNASGFTIYPPNTIDTFFEK